MTGELTPAGLADTAAEATRALNHATIGGTSALTYPGDAYDVIGALSVLAARLPQAVTQLDGFLTTEVEHGRVIVDAGEYVDDTVAAAAVTSHWLHIARTAAEHLHHALDAAQQAVAFMAAAD